MFSSPDYALEYKMEAIDASVPVTIYIVANGNGTSQRCGVGEKQI